MMNTSGTGGFILHTIKVYDDPEASSVLANRRKAKIARLQETASTEQDVPMEPSGEQVVVKAEDLQEEDVAEKPIQSES